MMILIPAEHDLPVLTELTETCGSPEVEHFEGAFSDQQVTPACVLISARPVSGS
jgi:hypothetical protein